MSKPAFKISKKQLIVCVFLCIAILSIVIAILYPWWYNKRQMQQYQLKHTEFVEKYAAEYGVDKALLYAVIRTESSFNANAVSSAGARGLTQITPDTFSWLQTKTGEKLELEMLFDPETSIKYGAFFLSMLLKEFGETETALAAYHAGRTKVNSWLKDREISPDGKTIPVIPIQQTSHYVNKVMSAYQKYKEIYDF
jgi:soluble lytic murein transglycosylase